MYSGSSKCVVVGLHDWTVSNESNCSSTWFLWSSFLQTEKYRYRSIDILIKMSRRHGNRYRFLAIFDIFGINRIVLLISKYRILPILTIPFFLFSKAALIIRCCLVIPLILSSPRPHPKMAEFIPDILRLLFLIVTVNKLLKSAHSNKSFLAHGVYCHNCLMR